MYVPETNFCEPQALLESLANLYFVFADALSALHSAFEPREAEGQAVR